MALRFLVLSIAALLAGTVVDMAKAAEAYVCDGGVLVMVKASDLERMKRENPCVASHYGLTVDPAAAAAVKPPGGRHESRPAAAISGLRGTTVHGTQTTSRLSQFATGPVRLINGHGRPMTPAARSR